MFNIYQDNMSSNVILPLGPDRTLTIFEWFFAEPGSGEGWESMQQTIAFSDEIQQEDIVICEQVQRGLRSRAYDTGRFSAKRENGVYHFQNLVREFARTRQGSARSAPERSSAVRSPMTQPAPRVPTDASSSPSYPRSSGSRTAPGASPTAWRKPSTAALTSPCCPRSRSTRGGPPRRMP